MKNTLIFLITAVVFNIDVDALRLGKYVSIKEAPYYVSLIRNEYWYHSLGHMCGGSILSEYWIITAAHCVKISKSITISAGGSVGHRLGKSLHEIEKIFIQGNYDDEWSGYDIALVKLKKPLHFNEYQQPIRLYNMRIEENDVASIYGLGVENFQSQLSPVLKKIDTTVITTDECLSRFRLRKDPRGWFCTDSGVAEICSGDSGSPVIIDNKLAGILSRSVGCDRKWVDYHFPGVFASIHFAYDWISETTGIH